MVELSRLLDVTANKLSEWLSAGLTTLDDKAYTLKNTSVNTSLGLNDSCKESLAGSQTFAEPSSGFINGPGTCI